MNRPSLLTWMAPRALTLAAALVLALATRAAGQQIFTNWVSLITHPVKDEATHELIRKLSSESDPMVREEMLQAFRIIKDPEDESYVRARLADDNGVVRMEALYTAAAYPLTMSPEQGVGFARDKEARVRVAFFEMLPDLVAESKREWLETGLADPDPLVRRAAARSAAQIGNAVDLLEQRLAQETDRLVVPVLYQGLISATEGEPRRGFLTRALASPAVVVVCVGLRQITPADASPAQSAVIARLADPVMLVQEEAVRAAQRAHINPAIPGLLPLLQNGDAALRRTAAEALGTLLAESVRATALAATAPLTIADVTASLARRVADEADPNVRRASADAMVAIHDESGKQALLELLSHKNPEVRRESAAALGQWAEPALVSRLFDLLNDPAPAVAAATAEALGRLRNPAAQGPLLERLAEGPFVVQERVAWSLGEFRTVDAVPALIKLLSSTNGPLETTVAEALGKIGDRRAIPRLHEMLYEMTNHVADVRHRTIRALLKFSDREILERVFKIVTERVIPPPPGFPMPLYDADFVRIEGLRFLSAMGDAKIAERLIKSFPELPSTDLRYALAETMTKLSGQHYVPIPNQDHRRYSVESLADLPYRPAPDPPGIELAAEAPAVR